MSRSEVNLLGRAAASVATAGTAIAVPRRQVVVRQADSTAVIRSVRELASLRDEWEAVAEPFRSPLLAHDWFLSCAEAFSRDVELRVLTTWTGGTLTGVAPLAHQLGARGPRLVLLGASRLHEPGGWLFSSPEALGELAALALSLDRALILQRVPACSPVCRALRQLPWTRAITVARAAGSSLAVEVRGSWDQYCGTLSSAITANLPRLRRKAERELGPMRVEHVRPTPAAVDTLLERFVSVEASGWKGRNGSALAARPELHDFFHRYGRRAASKNQLVVSTLWFGPHVGAVELAVEASGRVWQLKVAYHDALARYYPGLHLTHASIRRAFHERLTAYEFLGSAETWERRWQPEERRYTTTATYPMTTAGVSAAGMDVAQALRRRLRPRQRIVNAS